jgi:3-hydroxyisobutyrate dehydrogenase-like beta-hydroxyacid dehydrogenase
MEHETTALPRLGVVGLGRMGLPMCGRLAHRGFGVTATDIRGELRSAALGAGARWAPSAGAVAAGAQVVITMMPGPEEVAGVVDELVAALAPGSTWIDMSTASPDVAGMIGAAAGPRGVHVLDAPVGGDPEAAREGRLLAFVGGAAADLAAQREVLGTVADRIVHVGPAGAGYAVKLLVNLLWFGQAVATAEALTLARRAGLDLEVVRAALGQSAAASRFLADDAAALLRGDDLRSFSLARCVEELSSVLALGDELAVPMELATAVAGVHRQALQRYGDVDGELLGARFVAERAGLSLRAKPHPGS